MENMSQNTGGLTNQEQASFESLKHLCREKGLLERPTDLKEEDVQDGMNDETTVLRFLQGCFFDVNAALAQFEEALATRDSVNAASAYEAMEVTHFIALRRMYPHWSGQRDKAGQPICMLDLGLFDYTAASAYKMNGEYSDVNRDAIVFHDYLTRFALPLCSAASKKNGSDIPVTSCVYLVDMSTLTLRQAWSLKTLGQYISKLLATCYPEVTCRTYILNAPSYFGTIWSFASKWVDERIASKLVFVPSGEALQTLEATISVDSIPLQFGGKCPFETGMTPMLDDELLRFLDWFSPDVLPAGPVKWIVVEGETRALVAVGTVEGRERREEISGPVLLN